MKWGSKSSKWRTINQILIYVNNLSCVVHERECGTCVGQYDPTRQWFPLEAIHVAAVVMCHPYHSPMHCHEYQSSEMYRNDVCEFQGKWHGSQCSVMDLETWYMFHEAWIIPHIHVHKSQCKVPTRSCRFNPLTIH
jgi:hypothetical protein